MTRCAQERPSRPGKAATGRTGRKAPSRAALAVATLALAWCLAGATARAEGLRDGALITEIKVEGNKTISKEKVLAKLISRPNRPFSRKTAEDDYRTLKRTGWFADVRIEGEQAPDGKGFALVFVVKEKQVLQEVVFEGRTALRESELIKVTGLKKGARAEYTQVEMARHQIRNLYVEKGYEYARVELVEGGKVGDTRIVYRIFEGPKVRLSRVEFVGNTIFSGEHLLTKVSNRPKLLGLLGATYHRDEIDHDARKLIDFYQELGYMDVQVSPVARTGASLGDIVVTYYISEGVLYKVRSIRFEGNQRISTAELRKDLVLHSGQPFTDALRQADLKKLREKYMELGYIDLQVAPEQRALNKPGLIDLVYKVDEGNPYRIGEINVHGNMRTRNKVILRELLMAAVYPGASLNGTRLDLAKKRLMNLQYFTADPEHGKQGVEIKYVNKRDSSEPYYEAPVGFGPEEDVRTRGQSPDPPAEAPAADGEPLAPGRGPVGNVAPFDEMGRFDPPVDAEPAIPGPPPSLPPAPPIPPAGRPGRVVPPPRTPPLGAGEPPGSIPSLPGTNTTDPGPDRNEPFENRSLSSILHAVEAPPRNYADLDVRVDEGPTGRFMLGVAANSYQGIFGNLVLHERNFDITNLPRSPRELLSGNAFRGAGQEFRVELMPGNLINYANVTFREPYLFNRPIGLGINGYGFTRQYPDWNERRVGGRFSLGYQYGTRTYADVAFRVEDVNFNGFRQPAPADYLAAAGHTFLSSLRPSIRFDDRNDPFLPTKGRYAEFSFEQGWGNFTFSKFTAEGRRHFLLGSRPDGTGPRFLTLRGFYGITSPDTPVYERFFAGDFRSMRGFYYRGVGPHIFGSNIGGLMSAIGSVEYQFPLMANDMLSQVFFCDFGTVERGYNFTSLRAAVGTGFRINIPAMGKLPLAFDLAFPIAKEPGDRTRYFHFFIGTFW